MDNKNSGCVHVIDATFHTTLMQCLITCQHILRHSILPILYIYNFSFQFFQKLSKGLVSNLLVYSDIEVRHIRVLIVIII